MRQHELDEARALIDRPLDLREEPMHRREEMREHEHERDEHRGERPGEWRQSERSTHRAHRWARSVRRMMPTRAPLSSITGKISRPLVIIKVRRRFLEGGSFADRLALRRAVSSDALGDARHREHADRQSAPPTNCRTNSFAGFAIISAGVANCTSLPLCITATKRPPRRSASSMSWVTKTMVFCVSAWMWRHLPLAAPREWVGRARRRARP